MLAMVELEGQKYVTSSLVIPMVEAIRKGFFLANERLQELGASIGAQQLEDGKDFNMESILSAMIELVGACECVCVCVLLLKRRVAGEHVHLWAGFLGTSDGRAPAPLQKCEPLQEYRERGD